MSKSRTNNKIDRSLPKECSYVVTRSLHLDKSVQFGHFAGCIPQLAGSMPFETCCISRLHNMGCKLRLKPTEGFD